MWNRRSLSSALLLAGLAFLVSCSDFPPTQPAVERAGLDRPTQLVGPGAVGLDREFSRIAQQLPGFGGMYRGDDGRLTVVMVGDAPGGEAQVEGVARAMGPHLQAAGAALAAQNVTVQQGQYDYLQLSRWNWQLLPLLGQDGVVFTHVDERRNRVGIGVEERVSEAEVLAAAEALGVPAQAVVTVTSAPVLPMTGTLQDVQRPRAGGPQIVFEVPDIGWFVCTLGFNVMPLSRGRSEPHFLTNSHCSAVRSQATGTEYFQALPEIFGGHAREFVGTEMLDPPFFTAPCFEGFVCRWSDALMARYDRRNPVNFGAIYRTTFFGTESSAGSIEVGGERGRFFNIAGEIPFPMVNDVVDKVGRTTGWTRGPVVITCGNFAVGETELPVAMLCQDVVLAFAFFGDSGSPVFTQVGDSKNVHLNGIAWGIGAINGLPIYAFSAMENIRLDLGEFTTH